MATAEVAGTAGLVRGCVPMAEPVGWIRAKIETKESSAAYVGCAGRSPRQRHVSVVS